VQRFAPQKIRRVISRHTAVTLQDLMAGVVDSGTASNARIDQVLFSGKTGTAQKPDFQSGGYHWDKYVSSFGGFFPRQEPRIAGIVIIDEPKRIHYGGYTAGPAFAEIARRITLLDKTRGNWAKRQSGLSHEKLERRMQPDFDSVTGNEMTASSDMAQGYARVHRWISEGSETGDPLHNSRIEECTDLLSNGTLPDLTGLSARDAVIILSKSGCRIEVNGSGRIATQNPKAGSKLDGTERVILSCSTKPGG
jgi:hypothetical protein